MSRLAGAPLVEEAGGEPVGMLAPIAEPDPMLARYQESMRRLVEVLNKHPWHIDALHHLAIAYGAQGREAEYRALEREAARVALGALPEGFDWRKSRIVYGVLDNRPFFRACHGVSVLMLEEGDEKGGAPGKCGEGSSRSTRTTTRVAGCC